MNVITFDVIMRDDGVVYISESQCGSLYKKYIYDGELGNITHEPNWLRLDRLPEKIEKVIPASSSIVRYELKVTRYKRSEEHVVCREPSLKLRA